MEQPAHPIKVAARRSGLSAHVIRAWEKRYSAVLPGRSGTERRLYSEEDIRRLTLLAEATRAGHPISSVVPLSNEQIESLLETARNFQRQSDRAEEDAAGARMASGDLLGEVLAATRKFDAAALNAILDRAIVAMGHQGLLQRLIAPMAEQIGGLWRSGEITAAHEHFFISHVKMFLGHASRNFAPAANAPRLVAGTPVGQYHELGAFMAAVAAMHLGWSVTYLGPALPAAEIAGAARAGRADVVALSIIYPEDDPVLDQELSELRRLLEPHTAIVVGGRGSPAYADVLNRIRASHVRSLPDLTDFLENWRRQPRQR